MLKSFARLLAISAIVIVAGCQTPKIVGGETESAGANVCDLDAYRTYSSKDTEQTQKDARAWNAGLDAICG